jgi:hypothetical protein
MEQIGRYSSRIMKRTLASVIPSDGKIVYAVIGGRGKARYCEQFRERWVAAQ